MFDFANEHMFAKAEEKAFADWHCDEVFVPPPVESREEAEVQG